jgi:hypothetical protein
MPAALGSPSRSRQDCSSLVKGSGSPMATPKSRRDPAHARRGAAGPTARGRGHGPAATSRARGGAVGEHRVDAGRVGDQRGVALAHGREQRHDRLGDRALESP